VLGIPIPRTPGGLRPLSVEDVCLLPKSCDAQSDESDGAEIFPERLAQLSSVFGIESEYHAVPAFAKLEELTSD
jgi:hypothetical protein